MLMLALLASGGCAHVSYGIHHVIRAVNECTGHDDWSHYHSAKTGQIVPRTHRTRCCSGYEPPFYGYQGTCWRQWPTGWINCPIIEEEVIHVEPSPPPPPGEQPSEENQSFHRSNESNFHAARVEPPKEKPQAPRVPGKPLETPPSVQIAAGSKATSHEANSAPVEMQSSASERKEVRTPVVKVLRTALAESRRARSRWR